MKVGGIISIIFGILSFIVGIAGLSTKYADRAAGNLGWGIGLIVLGFYLLNRASQQKEEQNEKDKWSNGKN